MDTITIIAIILVLSVALTDFIIFFWYYPRYIKNRKPIKIKSYDNAKEIVAMSCNLRFINHKYDFFKKSWFYRANLVLKNIEAVQPTVIGFQEAIKCQYQYLCDTLPQYDSIITFRDKGKGAEGNPIFYRKDIYELIDKNSFWLSETPEVMSKDWGSLCHRICSYTILREKSTGKKFVVFNTHLDHGEPLARIKGVEVIRKKIKEFDSLPSILMGDFNAEENTTEYNAITESFLDSKYETENSEIGCTYQGFGVSKSLIDYIMISKSGFKVNSYSTIDTTYNNIYPSDHFPIVTKLSLK